MYECTGPIGPDSVWTNDDEASLKTQAWGDDVSAMKADRTAGRANSLIHRSTGAVIEIQKTRSIATDPHPPPPGGLDTGRVTWFLPIHHPQWGPVGHKGRGSGLVGTRKGHRRTHHTSGVFTWQPTRTLVSGSHVVAARVWQEIKESQVTLLAAGVAFRALLALFPALLAAVSVFGMVADPNDLTDQIRTWLAAVPQDVGQLLEN